MFGWLLNRLPKLEIRGADGTLYLRRYYLVKTRLGGIYIHQIMRSDDDRCLHDHPWDFSSVILSGHYTEITPETCEKGKVWKTGSLIKHSAEDAHRLVLENPVWTLVFIGRKAREWGFHTASGWTHWRDYLNDKFSSAPKSEKDKEIKDHSSYMD
jgi:hypothetical protein